MSLFIEKHRKVRQNDEDQGILFSKSSRKKGVFFFFGTALAIFLSLCDCFKILK